VPNYTTPPTVIAGQPLPATDWNTKIRDSMEALAKPSRCKVSRAAVQSIPNNAITPISWTAEDYDVDGMFAIGTPTDLVAPVAGLYQVIFNCGFANAAAGARQWSIALGGVNIAQVELPGSSGTFQGVVVTVEQVAPAGGIFTCRAFQNSGAALNATTPLSASVRLVAR